MNNNIQSLVEEAIKDIQNTGHMSWEEILTSLAEQASQNGLKPLPSEVPEEFLDLFDGTKLPYDYWNWVIQHFGTPPAEWWHGLRNGDKFKDGEGCVWTYNGKYSCIHGNYFLYTIEEGEIGINVDYCSPYTSPTDTFRSKLTPELQEEFDEVIETINKK